MGDRPTPENADAVRLPLVGFPRVIYHTRSKMRRELSPRAPRLSALVALEPPPHFGRPHRSSCGQTRIRSPYSAQEGTVTWELRAAERTGADTEQRLRYPPPALQSRPTSPPICWGWPPIPWGSPRASWLLLRGKLSAVLPGQAVAAPERQEQR